MLSFTYTNNALFMYMFQLSPTHFHFQVIMRETPRDMEKVAEEKQTQWKRTNPE